MAKSIFPSNNTVQQIDKNPNRVTPFEIKSNRCRTLSVKKIIPSL